jgi:gluconolactonase
MKHSLLICVLIIASAAGLLWSQSSIIAPNAKLELLSEGFSFTEGCASDAAGNVYFTDQPNDRIHIWSVDGKLSTYMQGSGRANGMSFDSEGNLFVCADEKNELRLIDSSGKSSILAKDFKGKLLNGPNDVWINLNGGLYFTDPFYKRDYWKRSPTSEQDTQGVYYLGPHSKMLLRIVDDLRTPNGIIGSPDGKILYIADIGANKTFKY